MTIYILEHTRLLGSCNVLLVLCLPVHTKKLLHIALVESQLPYCSPIWHLHLIKDIVTLERIKRRATKFIIGSHLLESTDRLVALKLFPFCTTSSSTVYFSSFSQSKTYLQQTFLHSLMSLSQLTTATRSAAHGKLTDVRAK